MASQEIFIGKITTRVDYEETIKSPRGALYIELGGCKFMTACNQKCQLVEGDEISFRMPREEDYFILDELSSPKCPSCPVQEDCKIFDPSIDLPEK